MKGELEFAPEAASSALDRVGWLGATLTLLGVIGVAAVGLGILLILPRDSPAPVVDETARAFPEDAAERARRARSAWLAFLEAPDFAARVAHVKDPERVEPLMRDYHLERGHPFPTMAEMSEGTYGTGPERQAVLFVVKPVEGADYAVAIEWSDGRFAVDWESLVAYGTMDWSTLLEERPAEPQLVRVFVSPLEEARQDPWLPEGSVNYVIEHRDHSTPAVLRVGPKFIGTMAWHIRRDRVPARLRVRGIEGNRSLELVDFVGPGF